MDTELWAEPGVGHHNSPRQGEGEDQIQGQSRRKGCRQAQLQGASLRQGLGPQDKKKRYYQTSESSSDKIYYKSVICER